MKGWVADHTSNDNTMANAGAQRSLWYKQGYQPMINFIQVNPILFYLDIREYRRIYASSQA